MRIRVFRVKDGIQEVLLVPGRRARRAPVLVRGTDKQSWIDAVRDVVTSIRTKPDVDEVEF